MNPDRKRRSVAIAAAVAVTAAVAVLVVFAVIESRTSVPGLPGFEIPGEGAGPPSPAGGRVTMIDLGAAECVPCKLMAPILEEVRGEYAGRADIVFIDVWKEPERASKYGIQAIPTQIFFDAKGREVYRHMGVLDKQAIVEILARLGVS